jgi:hypothetical protein
MASGHLNDASASFASGLRNAGSADDVQGKLRFVTAYLPERQGKWAEAKSAWDEYTQFVRAHPHAKSYLASAVDRMKMIDAGAELETKVEAVKQRIAQRPKESPAPAPEEAPKKPPAKKK